MPIVQQNYEQELTIGRAGEVANMQTCDADSYIVDETDGIGFGLGTYLEEVSDEPRLKLGATNAVMGVDADPTTTLAQGTIIQYTQATAGLANHTEYDGATADAAAAVGDTYQYRGTNWVKIVPTKDIFAVTNFAGISVKDITRDGADNDSYKDGVPAAAMWRGDIYVEVDGAVDITDDVTVDNATGEIGATAASLTRSYIPNARFISGAASGALAILRVGF